MRGNLIVAGILAALILCGFAFHRFLTWKDNREMDEVERTMHHVRQGMLNTPYNSVEW